VAECLAPPATSSTLLMGLPACGGHACASMRFTRLSCRCAELGMPAARSLNTAFNTVDVRTCYVWRERGGHSG
jgi:hypothetical protein